MQSQPELVTESSETSEPLPTPMPFEEARNCRAVPGNSMIVPLQSCSCPCRSRSGEIPLGAPRRARDNSSLQESLFPCRGVHLGWPFALRKVEELEYVRVHGGSSSCRALCAVTCGLKAAESWPGVACITRRSRRCVNADEEWPPGKGE